MLKLYNIGTNLVNKIKRTNYKIETLLINPNQPG